MRVRALRLLGLVAVSVFLGYLIGTWQPEQFTLPPQEGSGFLVANLSVQPEEVQPNEIVTITASISNTHDAWGIYTLVLDINGFKETEGKVMVAAGSTQDVSFSVKREKPGTYDVFINGLFDSFTVVQSAP